MKVVITGGCGFIGSHLARRGLEEGWEITAFDNFSRFGPHQLRDIQQSITITRGDVDDLESMKSVVKGSDVVFHLAGISRAVGSVDNPSGFFHSNVGGTHNVFESCRGTSTRVVFASSYIVYGRKKRIGLKTRERDRIDPATPYALSKYVGEKYAHMYANLYRQDNISLRFSNVYGPNDKDRVIPAMIARALKGSTIRVNGNPHFLNFIYVDDLVDALISIANIDVMKHRVYNLGSAESVNLIDLARLIVKECGSSSGIDVGPLPPHEPAYFCPDTFLASKDLDFAPRTALEEGIRRCVSSVGRLAEDNGGPTLQSLSTKRVT
jgi:nucleoside-diphosphate-sugar epimerase